jgi:hypothetical protein
VYLTVEPTEAAIPSREAAQLCIEAYRSYRSEPSIYFKLTDKI